MAINYKRLFTSNARFDIQCIENYWYKIELDTPIWKELADWIDSNISGWWQCPAKFPYIVYFELEDDYVAYKMRWE